MSKTIVEATIADLQDALKSGQISSVELTAKHLLRIAKYDRRALYLNSTPIINLNVFDEAQASDDARSSGKLRSDLEGIPCTIKDSYKIKGMTIASGSPAFENLIATEDAFTVAGIKAGGGIILGKTNMPPMAAGGMQRGLYGRAESPYNEQYLTAAFASGSSNGSATATAASFGLFGMGEETISSGRSPASNNGLVAYTGSRGMISIRGKWPLFPNCDTVVPHTRTVKDMFSLLDVLVAEDKDKRCDFWREQPFVPHPNPESIRPATFHSLSDSEALKGKIIGVPRMYIGEHDPAANPVHIRPSVRALWDQARRTLESLGATVKEVDFPIVTDLEAMDPKPSTPYFTPLYGQDFDMVQLMAYTWDDFLRVNSDTSSITTLAQVEANSIFPPPPGFLPDRYGKDDPLVKCSALVEAITPNRPSNFSIPNLGPKLHALETTRKEVFESWLSSQNLACLVWPCQGDVGLATADKDDSAARDAWRNGVLYSNGNCAIPLYGTPTVNIPMGNMEDTGRPVNLTFVGRAYDDKELLKFGYAFEQARKGRRAPGRTPGLVTDAIGCGGKREMRGTRAPKLAADARRINDNEVKVSGFVDASSSGGLEALEIYVDGDKAASMDIGVKDDRKSFDFVVKTENPDPSKIDGKKVPDIYDAMMIVLAKAKNGRAAAKLIFVSPKVEERENVARL